MKLIFIVLASIFHCMLTLARPNGLIQLASEMIVLRTQLLAVRKKRKKAPPLTPGIRLTLAMAARFIPRRRLSRAAVIVSPATILKFHRYLVRRKYSKLFSNTRNKGGRPRISAEIRKLVVEIKTKNPMFGCPQIAAIVYDRTGVSIDKETVRRVLLKSYHPPSGEDGPSWLTFLGSQADSLWSCDLFRVESVLLKSYWVLVVMDQYSRSIVGFAVNQGSVAGSDLCRMFNEVIADRSPPKRLSHDNDPLFLFEQWKRNMGIYEIDEVRSAPFCPTSHPFCERLIGTVRRELIDRTLFWSQVDLQRKLDEYMAYYNEARVHSGINGNKPGKVYRCEQSTPSPVSRLRWRRFCNGLFSVPEAA